jgi:5-oxoprolinase (ATP-hydrolysing)
VGPGAVASTALEARYVGPGPELTVATLADFPAEHRRRNGFTRPEAAVEVVALRASAVLAAPLELDALPDPPPRHPVRGPAVVAEPDCTIWVPSGWAGRVGAHGIYVLERPG